MAAINPFYNDEETEEEEDEEGGALLPEPVKVTENSVEEEHSVEFIKIFKLFLPVHKKNQKSCAQVQIDLQRVVHHGRG